MIALTATELFCGWHVEQAWKELGGQGAKLVTSPAIRLDNLSTLATLIQQIYLDLPDAYAHFYPPAG